LNSRFHEVLGTIAANSVLQEMMRSLRERTALLFAPANLTRARTNWDEHAQILQAVIAGDADLASLLATRHVYSAAKAVEAMNPATAASAGQQGGLTLSPGFSASASVTQSVDRSGASRTGAGLSGIPIVASNTMVRTTKWRTAPILCIL
jgi:hypothetical protein